MRGQIRVYKFKLKLPGDIYPFIDFSDSDEIYEQFNELPGFTYNHNFRAESMVKDSCVLIHHGYSYYVVRIVESEKSQDGKIEGFSGYWYSLPKKGKHYSEESGMESNNHRTFSFPASDIVQELPRRFKLVEQKSGKETTSNKRHKYQFPDVMNCRRYLENLSVDNSKRTKVS